MVRRLRLDVFDDATAGDGGDSGMVVLDANALEEARLAAFESGYRAGWDDACAAQSDDEARLRAEVARSLQGLAFTFHEARAHVLAGLEPLITDLIGKLLPEIARAALPAQILEVLLPLAATASEAPVTLLLGRGARSRVEALIAAEPGLPLEIVEEPALGDGQAWLRHGEAECRIDLDAAAEAIRRLVADFFSLARREPDHG